MKKAFCFIVVFLLLNFIASTFVQAQDPVKGLELNVLPDEEVLAEEVSDFVGHKAVSDNRNENPDSYVYCKMEYGWKRSMMLDFGIKGLDVYITDDNGKRMAFYDKIAALNCMSARGWELVDIFTTVSKSSSSESISSGKNYVIRKKLGDLDAQEREIYDKYIR